MFLSFFFSQFDQLDWKSPDNNNNSTNATTTSNNVDIVYISDSSGGIKVEDNNMIGPEPLHCGKQYYI